LVTLVSAFLLALPVPRAAIADDPLIIGVLTTLEGAFEPLGRDAIRGYELAIEEFGHEAGGRQIEALIESTDGTPESVTAKARLLIDRGARILIGPLAGIESLAIREFAKEVPEVTIINGASAAQDATLRSPADNFFRFNPDSMQWIGGLGTYAYENRGIRRIVAIAEDYSFPYTQLMGFMVEYCALGGHVIAKHWVSHGAGDFDTLASTVAETETDALFVALDPDAARTFLVAYWAAGGRAAIVAGSTTLNGSLLTSNGTIRPLLDGALSALPVSESEENEAWAEFSERYQTRYPDADPMPSLFALTYYINTKALLLALEETDGELGEQHETLRNALATLRFETPLGGPVQLDENRHAVANAYIVEVDEASDGSLYHHVVEVVPNVGQTFGLPREEFLSLGPPSRDNPTCP
jgi:branched-chain amino acid transport system substrate-binding protein